MSKMPKCIQCGSNRRVYHDGDRNYFCTACKIGFDDAPEEGGDYCQDPTMRLQREENRAQGRRQRRKPR